MVKKRRLIYSDSFPMSRINELPDEILVLILSKLTMKEAARTSILSHRWENLWVYYAGSLNFHPVHALDFYYKVYFQRPRLVRWVNLSDEALAYFILNCQSLEHLSITGASLLTYLNATTASKLKRLEISRCHGLKNVDISNTNIESLKFNGNREILSSLKKLHLLSALSLAGEWCCRAVCDLFQPLPLSQLHTLELDFGHYVPKGAIEFAEVFPTFCNLKQLKVYLVAHNDQNIFCLTSLICASPLLNSFTLKLQYKKKYPIMDLYELPNCEWRNSEERIHKCLKVVEIIGWYGYNWELDLIYYLIEKSVVLEKVIIDPKVPHLDETRSAFDPTEEVSRDRAKLVQKNVPPGMEFLIL